MRVWFDKNVPYVGTILFAACLTILAPNHSFADQTGNSRPGAVDACQLTTGARVSVLSIENSETLKLTDGRVVRLLGVLGPRPPLVNAATSAWPAEQQAQDALRILVGGRQVTLAFDQRRRDRYGQILAHVFVWHNGNRLWVQGELLAHGHARAAVLPGNTACLNALISHERLAHAPPRGVWRRNFYRVLKPNPPKWLLTKQRHRFVIIEGRISNVAIRKSKIYLNFGKDWRRDFTAALHKRGLHQTSTTLADLIALKGQRVRVRGWIERRNGPYIKLAHPGLIERMGRDQPNQPDKEQRRHPKMARQGDTGLAHWQRKQHLTMPRLLPRKKNRPQTSPSANDLKL